MSEIAKKKRRDKAEMTEFFSRKMKWLTEHCASPDINDHKFRVLFSLAVRWLFNADDFCAPLDAELGASCAKSEDSAQRITRDLHEQGVIVKTKKMRRSRYEFVGLTVPLPVQEHVTPDASRDCSVTRPGTVPSHSAELI